VVLHVHAAVTRRSTPAGICHRDCWPIRLRANTQRFPEVCDAGDAFAGTGVVIKGGKSWGSSLQGGTGSVTLTTLTANHIVGTFAFSAVASGGGATGTSVVTNGQFDITF
jgi:hypothetical protein